ncbi:MAG: diacylglycerol kinase [Candidatus Dadabacteria bacterium]|nr:diacylglycerol kinase [Candidatus Dadabacteria bacterium]
MEKGNKPGKKGIIRIWHALLYSISGLHIAFKNEAAIRQELLALAILSTTAVLLPVSTLVKIGLILSIVSVIIVELLNSAIERVVDLASPQQSTLAKEAKDMGSSAVLLAIVYSTVFWVYILVKIFIDK